MSVGERLRNRLRYSGVLLATTFGVATLLATGPAPADPEIGTPLACPLAVSLVKDINPGGSSSPGRNPSGFFKYLGELYFDANGGTASGNELYKVRTDGSVVRVADINPSGDSFPGFSSGFAEYGHELYFAADGGPDLGRELFKVSRSGSVVLVADINEGADGSDPRRFVEYRGELYLSADGGPTVGNEIYKVTKEGNVVLVADIDSGGGSSAPTGLTKHRGELYFAATMPDVGRELFKVRKDGSFVLVADLFTGSPFPSGDPVEFTEVRGELYFSANGDGVGREPHKIRKDGSVVLVADINPTGDSARLQPGRNYAFTEYRGNIYFAAIRPDIGRELFKIAKNGTVVLAEDINPGPVAGVLSALTPYRGELYFGAQADPNVGFEVYKLAPSCGEASEPSS